MKCDCGGILEVQRTEEKKDFIKRYRKCAICGSKMTTKESNTAMLEYQLWWIKRFKTMYKEYENKDWNSKGDKK